MVYDVIDAIDEELKITDVRALKQVAQPKRPSV